MKKLASALVVLVVILSLTVGSVLADGLMYLRETRNDWGGNVIFVLEFTGDFPRKYFQGYVTEGDHKYPIHCNVVSENTVQCTVSRMVAGKNVVLHVGEFIFWTFVPEAVPPQETGPSTYCYNVYDVFDVFDEDTEEYLGFFWEVFDVHCQDAPAAYGDTLIDYPNPYYGGNYDYQFGPDSPFYPCAVNSVVEDAYYYSDSCSDG